MLPQSKCARTTADIFSLMAAVSGDRDVIDLNCTSESTLKFDVFYDKWKIHRPEEL